MLRPRRRAPLDLADLRARYGVIRERTQAQLDQTAARGTKDGTSGNNGGRGGGRGTKGD